MRAISTAVVFATTLVGLMGSGCLVVADAPLIIEDTCDACEDDRDCPGGFCATDEAGCRQCVDVACFSDSDCDGGRFCDPGRNRCEVPLVCDANEPDLGCGPAEQCLVLDVQGCRAPPLGDTCALWPPSRTVAAGPLVVAVVGRAADGRLVPAGRAGFEASVAGAAVLVEPLANDRIVVDAACAGPDRCVVEVAASVGAARCQASYVVVPAGPDDDVQVIVADEDMGGRIAGAAITVAAEGSLVTGVTDDDGVFVAPGIGRVVERVTVAAAGFDGWSCLGCDTTLDVALPRRLAPSAVPAIAGAVEYTRPVTDLVVGLAGLPLTTPSFEAGALFGVPGSVPLDIAGITPPEGGRLVFASGATAQLGDTTIRDGFVAFGRPSGRALWAFGGTLPLSKISVLFGADDVPVDIRLEMLRALGPVARSGLLGAVVPMPTALLTSPPGQPALLENLGGPGDARVLADVDVAADVELTFTGPLPAGASDIVVVVGAVLPGEGLIPLGGDVFPTNGPVGLPASTLHVSFAPPHDGLEGRALRLLVVAVDVDALIARNVLGQDRILVEVDGPAPGRVAAITLPPFAVDPQVRLDGNTVVVDDVSDLPVLEVRLPLPGGGVHTVAVTGAVAGTAIGLDDVLGDLGFDDLALDPATLEVGGRDQTATSADPWAHPGRTTRR